MNDPQQFAHERIIQDPAIMVGKPVIKGTRIPVERVIEHLAANPELAEFFAAYPELTIDDVRAALAFAGAALAREQQRTRRRNNPSRRSA